MKYTEVGDNNLNKLAGSINFNKWMYSHVSRSVQGRVLEVGSGIGTISDFIVNDKKAKEVVLSDIDEDYSRLLAKKYHNNSIVKVTSGDISNERFRAHIGLFDAIVAINVVEHIYSDSVAMENMAHMLNPKGKIILLVPAHARLFNTIDVAVGHFRRYSKTELIELTNGPGLVIKQVRYFNFITIPAWYVKGKLIKDPKITTNMVSVFDKMIPLIKRFDDLITKYFTGISLIATYEKEDVKE